LDIQGSQVKWKPFKPSAFSMRSTIPHAVIFKRLRKGTRSVRELADGMDVSRPAVSQHLKVLQDARLIVARTEGTRRLYAIDTRGLEALRNVLSVGGSRERIYLGREGVAGARIGLSDAR